MSLLVLGLRTLWSIANNHCWLGTLGTVGDGPF